MDQIHFALLFELNDDVLLEIICYIEPHDIQRLFHYSLSSLSLSFSFKMMMDIFQRNSHFKMPCYTYIHDDIVEWFEMNHLSLDLMVEKKIFDNGDLEYLKNGKRHRDDDLPAFINTYCQSWFQNGKKHRENDLPAIICTNGRKKWYQNGKLHRENNQPAVINKDGTQKWY
jgi:hypothetical protein